MTKKKAGTKATPKGKGKDEPKPQRKTNRYTVTVPEDLLEKIEQYKDKLNLSEIFREAVKAEIERREAFVGRLSGILEDEEDLVTRLQREKAEEEQTLYQQGREDAIAFANAAPYRDLIYAVNQWEPQDQKRHGGPANYDPREDRILGDWLVGVFDEYGFVLDERDGWPDDGFQKWERGWIDGVLEIWRKIEGKL